MPSSSRGKLNWLLRVLAVASVLAVGGAIPAAAAPTTQPAPASGIVFAGVDDFVFESFDADYYLDTDEDGRSTLRTVETFVAVFPEIDQNRGMIRAIPESYQGAPTDVDVISVTDENGTPRPVETDTEDGFVLVTSRASDFVHGRQTYVFTYEQHNVTRFFENTDSEELYWDTNGTGWAQSFGRVTARVHVPDHLAASLTGDVACYQGREGSNLTCDLRREDAAGETIFTASASNIAPYANVTVALGFEAGTFVPRDDSYLGSGFGLLQALAAGLAALGAVFGLIARRTKLADGKGRPTIIAEYAPPKDIDLYLAAVIMHKTSRATAAQMIDFAVRRRVRVIETERPGFLSSSKQYVLQLLDGSGLAGAPLQLAHALFGPGLQPGTQYSMVKSDTALSKRVREIVVKSTKRATAEGYRKTGTAGAKLGPLALGLLGAFGAFITGVFLFESASGGWIPAVVIGFAVLCLIIVFGSVARSPLTEKGAQLRDHLKGLELYIRLAEADRMRVLQSPEGAERTPVATGDPGEVLKIYEKLLPYAVLFKFEERWAAELGKFYVDESPDWYSGSGTFHVSVFAASIASMSTSVSTSYSGSSSSSSSGGSGGGGSSGGGGGGGGGGGA